MIEGIIYCATSPSRKKYYGFTSTDLNTRKYYHIRCFKKGKRTHFYTAFQKYGWENFKWEIIETFSAPSKKELKSLLCEREIFWIEKDKTFIKEYGYNMTKGGDGRFGNTHSKKTRSILSEKLTGRTTERRVDLIEMK
jgi:group I intron endonuclease